MNVPLTPVLFVRYAQEQYPDVLRDAGVNSGDPSRSSPAYDFAISRNRWGSAHVVTLKRGKHVIVGRSDAAEVTTRAHTRIFLGIIWAAPLLRYSERCECELRSVKSIVMGGSSCSANLVREVQDKLGCKCFHWARRRRVSWRLKVSR